MVGWTAARSWSDSTYSHVYLHSSGSGTRYTPPDQQPNSDGQPDPNWYCQPYTYTDTHAHANSYPHAHTYLNPNPNCDSYNQADTRSFIA